MEKTNNNGKFFNGFVCGLIIGAAITFLLVTKKGRKILKMISEEGLELTEFFEEEEDVVPEKNKTKAKPIEKAQVQTAQTEEQLESADEEIIEEVPFEQKEDRIIKITPSKPRFFRGIHKR